MHTRKIALLGFGTVGQGLWQLLHTNRAAIQRSVGAAVEVARILVRDFGKARAVTAPTDLFTTDFADILATPDVAVVVEMMGGIEPANSYIRQALQSGKHVVTASKALMASHGAELVALATKAGVSLRYEAAVCAAIPIVNVLQSSLAAERITSLAGILNGT
ncbi:MAG TPA: homoserine dehydrogenase, partial [Firmicutes bacterium]|nr:homoserine dehydrogenase [Bacillota bacterium]